jgi:predicted membrane protein
MWRQTHQSSLLSSVNFLLGLLSTPKKEALYPSETLDLLQILSFATNKTALFIMIAPRSSNRVYGIGFTIQVLATDRFFHPSLATISRKVVFLQDLLSFFST